MVARIAFRLLKLPVFIGQLSALPFELKHILEAIRISISYERSTVLKSSSLRLDSIPGVRTSPSQDREINLAATDEIRNFFNSGKQCIPLLGFSHGHLLNCQPRPNDSLSVASLTGPLTKVLTPPMATMHEQG